MSSEEITVIPEDRQLVVRRIIDVLNSGPKLEILKILSEGKPLTASELSEKLKVKISTVLSHLDDLINTGLVKVETSSVGGRAIKKYSLVSNRIVLTINIRTLTHIEEIGVEEYEKELEHLTLQYIKAKRERKGELPLAIKVRDVAKTLNISIEKAIGIVDYINTHPEVIVDNISYDLLKVLRENKVATIRELADRLKVHPYWVVMAAKKLTSQGLVVFEENIVKVLSKN
ncbi:MAG: hypothetical protein DRO23_06680 [Thermoprotei archaeon]|nr:MAG: hypothetical protein DRO23_06680 [Thermoprotei archaeon]